MEEEMEGEMEMFGHYMVIKKKLPCCNFRPRVSLSSEDSGS